MGAIITALRHRGLRLLLSAGLISLAGDWVLRIGLAYYVYALTGSTLASALMLLSSFVPQIVLGSIAGVFVDRWSLKPTMVTANLLLTAGLVPLMVVHHANQIWIVYLVIAYEGCVQQFFIPAAQSLLPHLVDDEHLVTANALNNQSNDLSRLIGSAIGGIVGAAGGITALALVDMATFLISAVLIARVAAPRREPRTAERGAVTRIRSLGQEWRDGARAMRGSHVLRVIGVFLLITSLGEGAMGTLFAPFVRSVLHASGTAYGLVVSSQAIGGIVGGLVAAGVGNRLRASRAFGWGAVAFGAIDLAMFLYPLGWDTIWPAFTLMSIVGVPGALVVAGAMTLVQRNSTVANRGRVFGAISTIEGLAVVVGTIGAGFLGQSLGIVATLSLQGGGYVAGGVLILVSLRTDADRTMPDRDVELDSTLAEAPVSIPMQGIERSEQSVAL